MVSEFGKYRVKDVIGKGAMGVVYLGFDPALERQVAIKAISSSFSERDLKTRFIREARSTGKLRHNNIVTIYDFGHEGDDLYIVMEYLEGSDVETMIVEKTKMDIIDKLEIIRQICLGLDYAHQRGVFHRDVKPANIRLSKEGNVKIVDFGLAAVHSSTLTKSDAVLGTPHYIAPERLQGKKSDGRSDQFSVGLIFYELLTYTRPFSGDSISRIIYQILNDEPKSLDPQVVSQFPELEHIIKKSIAKDKEHRYKSMQSMAADIEALQKRMKEQGFSRTGPIKVTDEPMQGIMEGADTHVLEGMRTVLSKRIHSRRLVYALTASLVVCILALIMVLVSKFFIPEKTPAALETGTAEMQTGFLALDVKPYAFIDKIVDMDNRPLVAFEKGSISTPLRLRLAAGTYQIIYSHPQWGGKTRTKTVTITVGQTVREKDRLDDKFIRDAIDHFSVSR
jgi:predicted Ser/Thr protein kinase